MEEGDNEGYTPLHLAVIAGNTNIIRSKDRDLNRLLSISLKVSVVKEGKCKCPGQGAPLPGPLGRGLRPAGASGRALQLRVPDQHRGHPRLVIWLHC